MFLLLAAARAAHLAGVAIPWLARAARVVGLAIAAAMPDVFAFAGAGLMAYGAGRIYEPAGFLVGGLFFLVVGGIGIWRRG